MDYLRIGVLAVLAFLAGIAAFMARDAAYMLHAIIVLAVAAGLFVYYVRASTPRPVADQGEYMDGDP
jgi:cytochrome c oxidase cbb3-type subunit 1